MDNNAIRNVSFNASCGILGGRRARSYPERLLNKLECNKRVRNALSSCCGSATARRNDDILGTVLAHVCDWSGIAVSRKVCDPQFLSSLCIERAEFVIDGRADENESAGSGDAAPDVSDATLETDFSKLHKFLIDPQRNGPCDSSGIHIHGRQCTIRRRHARYTTPTSGL